MFGVFPLTSPISIPSILLKDTRVRWFSSMGKPGQPLLRGRGYVFFDRTYQHDQNVLEAISESCQASDIEESVVRLKKVITKLNGCWALVAEWADGRALAAVDRSRSIPLFYCDTPTPYAIASSPEPLHTSSSAIDTVAATELMVSGYISGRHTLFAGIQQIQAGEWVEFALGLPAKPTPYFHFSPDNSCSEYAIDLEREPEDLLDAIFKRFAAALKDRHLILPLSGGYDSRLIGWLLYKNGIRDVLCYTYGVETNPQVEIAHRLAEALGYR